MHPQIGVASRGSTRSPDAATYPSNGKAAAQYHVEVEQVVNPWLAATRSQRRLSTSDVPVTNRDAAESDSDRLSSAVRALARGGRLVAPTESGVPRDVEELARDEREWVGEVRVAASGLVPLRRGGDPMLR